MRNHFASFRRTAPDRPSALSEARQTSPHGVTSLPLDTVALDAPPGEGDLQSTQNAAIEAPPPVVPQHDASKPKAEIQVPQGAAAELAEGQPSQSAAPVVEAFEREERLAIYGEPEAQGGGALPAGNHPQTPAAQRFGGGDVGQRKSADSFQSRPTDWTPEQSAGVRITAPAVAVSAVEYDHALDVLIAALPPGSPEVSRIAFAKRKGWVTEFEGRRIYTRGRF